VLRRRFGDRFRGGYSAPYDTWPDWLAREWRAAGGAFVSWMFTDPARGQCPSVRMPIDPWDWQRNEHRSEADLTAAVTVTLAEDNRAGLVLHPQCLTTREHRAAFEDLVDALLLAGCEPFAVSATALAARKD
jgi:hypothetical protein